VRGVGRATGGAEAGCGMRRVENFNISDFCHHKSINLAELHGWNLNSSERADETFIIIIPFDVC